MRCEASLQVEGYLEHIVWSVIRTTNVILSVMRNTPSLLFVEGRMVHIFLAADQGLWGKSISGLTQIHIIKTLHFAGEIFPCKHHLACLCHVWYTLIM